MKKLKKISQHPILTAFGEFMSFGFLDRKGNEVLVLSSNLTSESPLLRVQFGCIHGTALFSTECDCRQQIAGSLRALSKNGGAFLYFPMYEALGFGLSKKLEFLQLEYADRISFLELLIQKGLKPPKMTMLLCDIPEILQCIGATSSFTLLTGRAEKVEAMKELEVSITKVSPVPELDCF